MRWWKKALILLAVVIVSSLIGLGIATNINQSHRLDHSDVVTALLTNDIAGLRAQVYASGQTPVAPAPEVRTQGAVTTVTGPKGDDGEKGPKGDTGPKGNDGISIVGPAGPQGEPGVAGAQGPEGKQGPQGEPGLDGANGVDGSQGPKGDPGTDGATGPQGPKGDPGTPALVMTLNHQDGSSETCVLDITTSAYTCSPASQP